MSGNIEGSVVPGQFDEDKYLNDDEVRVLVDAAWGESSKAADPLDEDLTVLQMALAWHEAGQAEDGDDDWNWDDGYLS